VYFEALFIISYMYRMDLVGTYTMSIVYGYVHCIQCTYVDVMYMSVQCVHVYVYMSIIQCFLDYPDFNYLTRTASLSGKGCISMESVMVVTLIFGLTSNSMAKE